MLGIQTRGGRMEGADVSTELRHSFFIAKTFFSVVHSPLRSYVTGQPTKHHDREGGINDNDDNNNNMLPLLSMAQQ